VVVRAEEKATLGEGVEGGTEYSGLLAGELCSHTLLSLHFTDLYSLSPSKPQINKFRSNVFMTDAMCSADLQVHRTVHIVLVECPSSFHLEWQSPRVRLTGLQMV